MLILNLCFQKYMRKCVQLGKENKLGVLITLIVGPDEMEKDTVTIKNMVSEEQKSILVDDLIDEIYKIIDEFEES